MDNCNNTAIQEFTPDPCAPDLTGKIFGRLVVIGYGGRRPVGKDYKRYWVCRCECGKEIAVVTQGLLSGHTQSCNCLRNDTRACTTHGLSGTPEHKVWIGFRKRCNNPNAKEAKNYIGRGIKSCAGFDDFSFFLHVIGKRLSSAYSIDRKNNDGHYSCGQCEQCRANNWPLNVKWSMPIEQQRNKRPNVFIEFEGYRRTLAEWSEILNIKYTTLWQRLYREGFPIAVAFTSNKLKRRPHKRRPYNYKNR